MSSRLEASSSDECEQPLNAMDLAGASDIGKSRESNQDHYLIADLQRLMTIRSSNVPHEHHEKLCGSEPGQLLVVADGMGGHAAGEVASSTAVESCAHYVLDMMHWFLKLSANHDKDFRQELSECLKTVQRKIWAQNSGQDPYHRMGTTVTMTYIVWPRMYIVHAGDSRCYLFRNGRLKQLTTDHTLAQQLVEEGALSIKDAETSHWRHVLWNCVGGSERTVQPEVTRIKLHPTDIVLLCSDGLTGMVPDQRIAATLKAGGSSAELVRELVSQANQAGGKDNITVLVAAFGRLAANGDDDSGGDSLVDQR